MKQAKLLFLQIAALAFASCGSDEPRYADPEAHEKTVQLNEQYGPLMVGTWHYENISDTQRYFECLMFQADGILTGMRNCLQLTATYDDEERDYMAYSCALTFAYADATTLRFQGYYVKDPDGWINYQRGPAEPGF